MRKLTIPLFILLLIAPSCKSEQKEQSLKIRKTAVQSEDGKIESVSGKREISGIYPHLTTYAHNRLDGTYKFGNESGIGALAVWNDKLYMINYAASQPKGSEHKLYIIDKDKNMDIFPGSIGGVPAGRMVHQESNQLFIGPYVVDSTGTIRVIPYTDMKGRLTAVARHLKDPENKVYYYDMEGKLYEVDVHSLNVKKLFEDPLPATHGKGGYTSQGRLVLSNNGERSSLDKKGSWKITKTDNIIGKDKIGVLAEFDGDHFKVLERNPYTDVTTKHGIYAVPDEQAPLWAVGWDKKSLRLKILDHGNWSTYLLPKAAYNNDPAHGWFTEWPRIRSVSDKHMVMDMHGMFFEFPKTFSALNTSGIKPLGSHLRYIPDFLGWNGKVVLGTDETTVQSDPLSGQPQSNLWFGNYEDLSNWGPSSAYGAVWLNEDIQAHVKSEPFLINGFDNKILHLKNYSNNSVTVTLVIDKNGDNNWSELKKVRLEPHEYHHEIFDKDLDAQWIRLSTDRKARLTAAFHFTDDNLKDPATGKNLFSALADVDYTGEVSHSLLYSNKNNFNLSVFSGNIENGKFKVKDKREFTKFDFDFVKGIKDSTAKKALKIQNIWYEDSASIVLKAKNYQLRLPKIKGNYNIAAPSGAVRSAREVESERQVANIGGTFYELPLLAGSSVSEPRYKMLRPIATHGKQISDFNSWNGLLVLSGIRKDAPASEHVYKSKDGKVGLWFGGVDDLWSFGKPRGEGGPWKNTKVKKDELSDMYLMTGYDKKSMSLKSDTDVDITLFVYINHYLEEPVAFKTFHLKAGKELDYEFPKGFSAHWAQLKANKACTATAWFTYK